MVKRGRDKQQPAGGTTLQRLAVGVLAGANAVAIFTTVYYVRVIGRRDRLGTTAAFQSPTVDLSGLGDLYEEDDPAKHALRPTAIPPFAPPPFAPPQPVPPDVPPSRLRSNANENCRDIPGWTDSLGFECIKYVEDGSCGFGLNTNYENMGHTADTACCACGGGRKGGGLQAVENPSAVCEHAGGVLYKDQRTCCAGTCEVAGTQVCGGPVCAELPGGRNGCCPSVIQTAGQHCLSSPAPCMVSRDVKAQAAPGFKAQAPPVRTREAAPKGWAEDAEEGARVNPPPPAQGPIRSSFPGGGGREALKNPNVFGKSELVPCPCKARPHAAPMPTTQSCPQRREDCRWVKHVGYHLRDYIDEIENVLTIEDAQDFCMDVGPNCRGVTCDGSGPVPRCTLREGLELNPSPITETTYVKDCSAADPTRCRLEQSGPTPAHPTASEDLDNAAIVILAHNRVESLQSCLESLLSQKGISRFKVFISIDDPKAFKEMSSAGFAVAEKYGVDVTFLSSAKREPEKSHNAEQIAWFEFNAGKIAWHYWVVLEGTFIQQNFSHAIFIEEDLVFAPDFLSLFRSTAWLLQADDSLWCVSAWNDIAFTQSVSDSCRLLRTSYFPGLGFLMRREAWLVIREQWPVAPTMGWDYWMRVVFRREGKECIIPEVSRSHHAAEKGSSVNSKKQVKFFNAMALSAQPDTCSDDAPCHQFGDASYLISDEYEMWLDTVLAQADGHYKIAELRAMVATRVPQANKVYVVNYVHEDYGALTETAGLRPKGTKGAIPSDIRAEHYGLFKSRNVESRAHLIFVNSRGPVRYGGLAPPEYRTVASQRGATCNDACAHHMQKCDAAAMSYVNNCRSMEKHFACEAGCAHQVGKELPVYVSDASRDTGNQCLITFISPMACGTAHPSTSRLCACTGSVNSL